MKEAIARLHSLQVLNIEQVEYEIDVTFKHGSTSEYYGDW